MSLVHKFKKWLYRSRYDSKDFKSFKDFITSFYDYYFEPDYGWRDFRLTKLILYNYPNSVVIEIHCLFPGLVIGPKGEYIDALKKQAEEKYYPKSVTIDLKETNPFR